MIGETIGDLVLGLSPSNTVCIVAKVRTYEDGEEFFVPLGRSYNGHPWETLAPLFTPFEDYAVDTSIMEISGVASNEVLHLFKFTHTLTTEEEASRFLSQATFGATKTEITDFVASGLTPAQFVRQQMDLDASYHREIFRKRVRGSVIGDDVERYPSGINDQACEEATRWRKYSWIRDDRSEEGEFTSSGTGTWLFSINGKPTTEFASLPQTVEYEGATDFTYVNTSSKFSIEWGIETIVGGELWLKDLNLPGNPRWLVGGNPPVYFPNGDDIEGVVVISLTSAEEDDFKVINNSTKFGNQMVNLGTLSDGACVNLSRTDFETVVVVKFSDDTYLRYEPSIVLQDNTLGSPIPDGGGSIAEMDDAYYCANVPRSFMNEDSCILSDEETVCRNDFDDFNTEEYKRELNENFLENLFEATGLYIYAVQQLRIEDATFDPTLDPCAEGVTTRWIRVTQSELDEDSVGCEDMGSFENDATKDTLIELLDEAWNFKSNSLVLDITGPGVEAGVCDLGTLPNTGVIVRGNCFKNAHEDYWSIFDFSEWAAAKSASVGPHHPGNYGRAPNPITRFAEPDTGGDEPTFFLDFPDWHQMSRWETNHVNFPYIGRYTDEIIFAELPQYLRDMTAVRDLFGIDASGVSGKTVVCGSRSEVANDRTLDDWFELDGPNDPDYNQRPAQVHRAALSDEDQLRQRVAWALNQIFVVSLTDVDIGRKTEVISNYYDTFVENAFGSYREIMKQVAWSPLMGEMLSYAGSRSTQLLFEWTGATVYPDENFAREIQQLFSIGLVKLNQDGTEMLDEEGNSIPTYDNDDVVSQARMWTGFEHHGRRGNHEQSGSGSSRIDSMRLDSRYRDVLPKMNLYDGYIGDGFPLCSELPERAFLRKGAKFRVLGAKSTPEMQYERGSFFANPDVERLELTDSGTDESLYDKLCGFDAMSGSCTYPSVVTLDANLACRGAECDVDTVSVVRVAHDVHYEYIRQPCVEMAFMSDARKVKHAWGFFVCGNPRSAVAAPACTETRVYNWGEQIQYWRSINPCEYVGEHVKYDTAVERCDHLNRTVEPVNSYRFVGDDDSFCDLYNWYAWTSDSCYTDVRVRFEDSKVALTHQAPETTKFGDQPYTPKAVVGEEGKTWFRAAWEGGVAPPRDSTCASPCKAAADGSCLCRTTTVKTVAFSSEPADLTEISSANLYIGAPHPDMYDAGALVSGSWTSGGVTVNYWYPAGESVAHMDTIFEVREKKVSRYFRNRLETVSINIGGVDYSFRNAPHFNSLFDTNHRDAVQETDALLDHLFYHDNVGPFVGYRMIQRFGISNPSPRYIAVVAGAFAEGEYVSGGETFGNGEYGNLEATIAAVLLDREMRSAILDADPASGSMSEPLLRVLKFFKAMEYTSPNPLLKFDDMDLKIGQEAHNIPTVFSYFLPEYSSPGAVAEAGVKSPEAYIANTPKVLGLQSGLFSMAKYGLVTCDGGFHGSAGSRACDTWRRDARDYAYGTLGFTPESMDPSAMVDELALLLAPGRLTAEHKATIVAALEEYGTDGEDSLLGVAQQLMVATPEFHTTNVIRTKTERRPSTADAEPPTKEYKAVVMFFLAGGADTFNLLVPHTCSPNMYSQYSMIRENISLPKGDLRQIDASGQVCSKFGLHPSLAAVQDLYNAGEASFLANTGVLFKPSDKTNYRGNNPTQLFAHNVMQRETKIDDPLREYAGTGVLGRMTSMLKAKGYSVNGISLADQVDAIVPESGTAPPAITLNAGGTSSFNPNPSFVNMSDVIAELNNKGKVTNSLYGETFSSVFMNALVENERFVLALESPESETVTEFSPSNDIERQLETVTRLVRASTTSPYRYVERDVYYVQLGGFDTHSDVLANFAGRMDIVNAAIEKYVAELKAQGNFNSVTTVVTSEFARTLTPNSGLGSDHAWGGNYFFFGGDVDGGKVHGVYPDDLRQESPIGLNNGRIIPTTSWDQFWNGVGEWFGLEGEELDYAVPNRGEFEGNLFTANQLFK